MMLPGDVPKKGLKTVNKRCRLGKQIELKNDRNVRYSKSKTKQFTVSLLKLAFLSFTIVPLYFFMTGYFTSKYKFTQVNDCELQLDRTGAFEIVPGSGCLEPTYKRAIVILVDALRNDFCEGVEIEGGQNGNSNYKGRLKVFNKYEKEAPEHAMSFTFIADPPTTTYQRLQGILAGSIPTFIEAGSNFFAQKMVEDSIVSQISTRGGKVTVLGDDTWGSLFSELLSEKTTLFPSLDTTDIDTVDDGIMANRHIINENIDSWKLLVTHFLGVDHVGHTYGPEHAEMRRKLAQMDSFIENTILSIDNDTILFVFGDHGMDNYGGHGGGSNEETGSFLFAYSKSIPIFKNVHKLKEYMSSLNAQLNNIDISPETFSGFRRKVSQTDFSSTLSLLLGIPIPFSNIGSPIPEFFTYSNTDEQSDISVFSRLATANRINAYQINRYTSKYIANVYPIIANVQDLKNELFFSEPLYDDCVKNSSSSSCILSAQLFAKYSKFISSSARKTWTKFNLTKINFGISTTLTAIILTIKYLLPYKNSKKHQFYSSNLLNFLPLAYLLFFYLHHIILPRTIRAYLEYKLPVLSHPTFKLLIIISPILDLLVSIFHHFTSVIILFSSLKSTVTNILAFMFVSSSLLFISFIFMIRSNSYVVSEQKVTLYILQTLNLILLVALSQTHDVVSNTKTTKNHASWKHAKLLYFMPIVLQRLIHMSYVCREEDGTDCVTTFYGFSGSSVSPIWLSVLRTSYILFIISNLNSLFTISPLIRVKNGTKKLLLLLEILSSSYYVIDSFALTKFTYTVSNFSKFFQLFPSLKALIADLAMIIQCTSLILMIIQSKKRYSGISGYYNLLLIVWSMLTLTQKPMGAIAMCTSLIQILLLYKNISILKERMGILLLNIEKNEKRVYIRQLIETIPLIFSIIYLYFLSWNTFYTTGHQATLSSIHWNSAFIGLSKLNWFISPILVVLNTFGSHVLIVFSIPMLLFSNSIPPKNFHDFKFVKATYVHIAYWLLTLLVLLFTMIHTSHMRENLFAWKIFAPKFIMIASSSVVTLFSIIISYVLYCTMVSKNLIENESGNNYSKMNHKINA